MSTTEESFASVVPAQLGFLAIYNPSLGATDETFSDQIVYYTSKDSRSRGRKGGDVSKEELNERLRQIGLAQGMVDFGKNFSEGRSVDTIETEKSRIILYELEVGWWILASIDLTRLPSASKDASANEKPTIEYSSREVKPAALLLQDLVCAHKKFLLHHASSVSALFVRNQRQKFIGIFGRYWDSFTATWNVLLHGNPAVKMYGGIKLAASGELGVGVGEEDRGSGERAVLEGLVNDVEGLVDVVVSRFGEPEKKSNTASHVPPSRPWLGSGEEPTHEDGAVFLGIGAISRESLRDITQWMEDLYTWGSEAYGVLDNPSSIRRKKVRRHPRKVSPLRVEIKDDAVKTRSSDKAVTHQVDGTGRRGSDPISPKPPSNSSLRSSESGSRPRQAPSIRKRIKDNRPTLRRRSSSASTVRTVTPTGKLFNYLKLGYGTHWTLTAAGSASKSQEPEETEAPQSPSTMAGKVTFAEPETPTPKQTETPDSDTHADYFTLQNENIGHYLIGLMGDIERETKQNLEVSVDDEDMNSRILLRTLTVELEGEARAEADISIDLGSSDAGSSKHGSVRTGTSTHASFESQDRNKTKKLRVVVYACRPFMFTFVFEQRTDSLSWPSLYHSLHRNLIPLQKPLLHSTSYRDTKPAVTSTIPENSAEILGKSPIYDLVWDPKSLTITTSIPDIPSPLQSYSSSSTSKQHWSRIEALTTHAQILTTYSLTRHTNSHHNPHPQELQERTCKTSRGFWISWTRIPSTPKPSISPSPNTNLQALLNRNSSRSRDLSNSPNPSQRHLSPSNSPSSSNLQPNQSTTPSNPNSKTGTGPTARSKPSKPSTGKSAQANPNTSIPTRGSDYSGPAHPFSEFNDFATEECEEMNDKEVFLIRRAGSGKIDVVDGGSDGGGGGWMSGGMGVIGGMGVDTTRYIDGLLGGFR